MFLFKGKSKKDRKKSLKSLKPKELKKTTTLSESHLTTKFEPPLQVLLQPPRRSIDVPVENLYFINIISSFSFSLFASVPSLSVLFLFYSFLFLFTFFCLLFFFFLILFHLFSHIFSLFSFPLVILDFIHFTFFPHFFLYFLFLHNYSTSPTSTSISLLPSLNLFLSFNSFKPPEYLSLITFISFNSLSFSHSSSPSSACYFLSIKSFFSSFFTPLPFYCLFFLFFPPSLFICLYIFFISL
ncbi:unnamed protein product [Acanthosepion pharaonis]|uniref:Uncharacterized protein n=1 Tax=Acanthosepion pharaonis TaxID=158019 RepID=A0A812EKV2_ACAPH|nr:unnamed protein product [Sepia pharaonis]